MLGIVSSLRPYLIVFSASACGLIIEIVAARILAPSIGVSLFTWTGIIGIVLAGISAGNYLGGIIADRRPYSTTLGIILLSAGVTSLAILPLFGLVSNAFALLPILLRIVFLTTALFFLPSLLLGMVTPVVIKLSLHTLGSAGSVVGRIYAVSTAGSIFGVFITGFVLIQWIGTRPILMGVALFLVLMALAFGNLGRAKIPGVAFLAVFISIGGLAFTTGSLGTTCTAESNYFCIKVREREIEGRTVKTLTLDQLLHSYVDLDDPTFLVYSYEKVFAEIATFVGQSRPDMNVLFIGGGGYTMPRFLETTYPQSILEVIEIDPEVTRVATSHLGLPADTSIVTYNNDARAQIPRLEQGKFDIVMGDAFNDVSVPFHLTTLEFNEQVKQLLREDGIYMTNVVDKAHSGKFLRSYVNTLKETFPHVYVLRGDQEWDSDSQYTYVVAGSYKPFDLIAIANAAAAANRGFPLLRFMPDDTFDEWFNSGEKVLLTDDYVPVDNMLAPLYWQSR